MADGFQAELMFPLKTSHTVSSLLQGGRTRRDEPHDHAECGHRVWTHVAAARDGDGQHRRAHDLSEPDRGAHIVRVREHFWQVES